MLVFSFQFILFNFMKFLDPANQPRLLLPRAYKCLKLQGEEKMHRLVAK